MKILLDTHTLYWFIKGDQQLSALARTTVGEDGTGVITARAWVRPRLQLLHEKTPR